MQRWRGPLVVVEALLCVVLLGWTLASGGDSAWTQLLSKIKPSSKTGAFEEATAEDDSEGGKTTYHVARIPKLKYLGEGRAELGAFSIKVFDPAARVGVWSEFKLEGQTCFPNDPSFQQFMRCNNRFIREQVMVTVRGCDAEDLDGHDLRILEKKIAARVNRTLGCEFLESVEIKNYAASESVNNSSYVPYKPHTAQ